MNAIEKSWYDVITGDNKIENIHKCISKHKNKNCIKYRFTFINDRDNFYLTFREMELVTLLYENVTTIDISKKLGLSKRTVEYYSGIIRRKINVSKTSNVVGYFIGSSNRYIEFKKNMEIMKSINKNKGDIL